MRIGDLIHALNVRLLNASSLRPDHLDTRICDITEDSRTVMPGSLFIARKGEKSDGKHYIQQAINAGAVAILTDDPSITLPPGTTHATPILLGADDPALATAQLAERFYADPSSKLMMVGVTGTNGKTTTTFLIHQMLNALGTRAGLIGTVVIDDGTEVAPASLTTPPALELSRTLARMHDAGCTACIMEVSSHSLDQHRVGSIKFNAGVFTNLTHDHLDYHRTMENYAAAKAMLFKMLPADGVAVVNIQDPAHSQMVSGTKARIARCAVDTAASLPITGGTAPSTVWRARVLTADTRGTEVEISGPLHGDTGPIGTHRLKIPLVGAFNVMNALQALVTVHALVGGTGEDDLSFAIIAGALERASAPPGRLEPVTDVDAPVSVFVDYAHTDDALQTILKVIADALTNANGARTGRLHCVFGCGGDRDKTKRPKMGRVAATIADHVIVTSDNPRTESPSAIITDILTGIPADLRAKVTVQADRETAIRAAITAAKPGDAVVIAGKGHEDYQILPDPSTPGKTITRHFDDREVARATLQNPPGDGRVALQAH
jgi:UDP-N-acetylmuramoyl-L-alanyl-D-glutamate--2,6-diaminopimelate ligase